MNSGYLTIIVLMAFGILLASGWKEYFFKGYSYKMIVLFIGGWLVCSLIEFDFFWMSKHVTLNLAFVFLLFFSLYLTLRLKFWLERLNVITISLVLSLLDFTLREASGLTAEYTAILMGLAVVTMQKSPTKQLACLFFAFLCSNVLSLLIHQRTQTFLLADQSYQDFWWLTVLVSRIFTVMSQQISLGFRKLWQGHFNKR